MAKLLGYKDKYYVAAKVKKSSKGTEHRWVISPFKAKMKKQLLQKLASAIKSVEKEDPKSEIWLCKVVPDAKGNEKWVCTYIGRGKSKTLKKPKKRKSFKKFSQKDAKKYLKSF